MVAHKTPTAKVDDLGARLERELGDNLLSFMLYGPAVRSEGTGLATTLLIVRDASPTALRSIETHIAGWTKKGNPPPLIFSQQEWRSSADVFPIEIEDMREAHVLIRGVDPLADVTTSRKDLRRELEREIRGKLLQLRAEFAAAASNGKQLGDLLIESARTFFVLFRATLRLVGRPPPQEAESLVSETGEIAGIDASCFEWILARIAGKKVPNLQEHDPVGDRYLQQIELLARFVDSFDAKGADEAPEQGSN
ncbi:MAG: hypothetical protein JSW71_10080 [Gemmatimonadota bacterium]|nr:MAG: hypothetical protein JSW71_10080 [Gemmatimonadota bacterium]